MDTEQYVISAGFENNIELNVPAFTSGDVNYRSISVSFRDLNSGDLSVRVSGADSNCCYTIPNTDVIEIALIPRETTSSTNLEVVTQSLTVDPVDSSFSVFYSQAVTVPASSVSLTYRDGFSILKGNDSTNDLILPGTTLLTGNIDVPVTHTMSLNDTKLTVTPVTALSNVGSYNYSIGNVEVNATGEIDNVSDSLSFTVTDSDQVFDINDVKLDNENYTTNGTVITSANTAGDVSSSSNSRERVYFYLPTSIQSLQNFTMRQVIATNNNTQRTDIQSYTFVDNGSIGVSRYGLVSLASNENVERENMRFQVRMGTAQPDTQVIYRTNVRGDYYSYYMQDKTSTSDNSITFEYAYETKAGEISTGTIVIPVQ